MQAAQKPYEVVVIMAMRSSTLLHACAVREHLCKRLGKCNDQQLLALKGLAQHTQAPRDKDCQSRVQMNWPSLKLGKHCTTSSIAALLEQNSICQVCNS
jgi:hypothetical protein